MACALARPTICCISQKPSLGYSSNQGMLAPLSQCYRSLLGAVGHHQQAVPSMHRSASVQANMLPTTVIFNQSHATNEQLPYSMTFQS